MLSYDSIFPILCKGEFALIDINYYNKLFTSYSDNYIPSSRSEKFYYILDSFGNSLFELPYREDFIYHCLHKLLYRTNEKYFLLEFKETISYIDLIPITQICDFIK